MCIVLGFHATSLTRFVENACKIYSEDGRQVTNEVASEILTNMAEFSDVRNFKIADFDRPQRTASRYPY